MVYSALMYTFLHQSTKLAENQGFKHFTLNCSKITPFYTIFWNVQNP